MAGCPSLTPTKLLRSLGIAVIVIPLVGGQTSLSQQVSAPPAMPIPQSSSSSESAPLVFKATVGAEKRLQSKEQRLLLEMFMVLMLQNKQLKQF